MMDLLEEEKPVVDPKRAKVIAEAMTFINFLLRHVAVMTFRCLLSIILINFKTLLNIIFMKISIE